MLLHGAHVLLSLLEPEINPLHGALIALRILLTHVHIFIRVAHCCCLCLLHILLESFNPPFLEYLLCPAHTEDLVVLKVLRSELPLQVSPPALFKLQSIGSAYSDVPLHKLEVLCARILLDVFDVSFIKWVFVRTGLPGCCLVKAPHSWQLKRQKLALKLILDEEVCLRATYTALPGGRKSPKQISVRSLLLDVPHDVKLAPDVVLRRMHHRVEVVSSATESAHQSSSTEFIQRPPVETEFFESSVVWLVFA